MMSNATVAPISLSFVVIAYGIMGLDNTRGGLLWLKMESVKRPLFAPSVD